MGVPPWGHRAAIWGGNGPPDAPMGPLGPLWGGFAPKGATWAPWALMGRIWLQALQGDCGVPRRGVFFHPENHFLGFLVKKMVNKKLRLRGWDLSGEICSGILRRLVLKIRKTVVWRPIW